MKKMIAFLLSAALMASFTACANTEGQNPDAADQSVSDSGQTVSVTPLELLNTVWDSYQDDEKFAAVGGDLSEEHVTTDAPGIYSLDDADALDVALGFPAASVAQIDDAASLVHMLNANTFTCGAYHLANAADADAVTTAIQDNIRNRQWICGFPEQLVIMTVGDCVVVCFGTDDIVDAFQEKLIAAYPSASLICEEPID